MIYWGLILLTLLVTYLFWRFVYFFRDPKRIIPEGNNIVSAADGTIIYVHKVRNGQVPISVKKGKSVDITDVIRNSKYNSIDDHWIIGVFMHPTSVHVNRAPISGVIESVNYHENKNLPMTITWWRVLLRIRPYERHAHHIYQNERNIITIVGGITAHVIQIADIYVNKIRCKVKVGDKVGKGQKIGSILFGSQVDIVVPCNSVEITCKEGDKVKAGETILAKTIL